MSLAYFEVGSGSQPVLLIHGFLGAGRNLSTFAKQWATRDPGLRIVVPDLTGHGDSPALQDGADLTTLARDLLAFARGIGLAEPFQIVGHSLGGRVGLATLLVSPDAIASLTLLDIAPSPIAAFAGSATKILDLIASGPESATSREPFREHLRAGALDEGLVQWQMMNVVQVDGAYRWRIDPRALSRLQMATSTADLWPAIDVAIAHRLPLHEVRGGSSPYVSDADAARLEAAGCTVDTLPGIGHFVHVAGLEPLLTALLRQTTRKDREGNVCERAV